MTLHRLSGTTWLWVLSFLMVRVGIIFVSRNTILVEMDSLVGDRGGVSILDITITYPLQDNSILVDVLYFLLGSTSEGTSLVLMCGLARLRKEMCSHSTGAMGRGLVGLRTVLQGTSLVYDSTRSLIWF